MRAQSMVLAFHLSSVLLCLPPPVASFFALLFFLSFFGFQFFWFLLLCFQSFRSFFVLCSVFGFSLFALLLFGFVCSRAVVFPRDGMFWRVGRARFLFISFHVFGCMFFFFVFYSFFLFLFRCFRFLFLVLVAACVCVRGRAAERRGFPDGTSRMNCSGSKHVVLAYLLAEQGFPCSALQKTLCRSKRNRAKHASCLIQLIARAVAGSAMIASSALCGGRFGDSARRRVFVRASVLL